MPVETRRNDRPYQLLVDGFPDTFFQVHSFAGEEALSEAYSLDVVVTAEATGEIVEQTALGRRAAFVMDVGEQQRAFHGVLAAVRLAEVHAASQAVRYVVRLVPRLWLLKRKKRTRIFQKMRVPDIVTAVLEEAGIGARWQLVRAYPVREYCTQYEETDYRFVKRILAEAGIYFYFPTGPAVDLGTLTAEAAIGAATAVGGEVLGAVAGPMGSAAASLAGAAASAATPLIPGDTVICADDAASYPPLAGDDPAALAAATAAALAPAVGDVLGVDGTAGAVLGGASAIAGTVIADATSALRDAPVLRMQSFEGARVSSLDTITRFSLKNRVKSSGAAFRDYDPARPQVRLESTAVSTQPFPPSGFEIAGEVVSAASSVLGAAGGLIPGAAGALGEASDVLGEVDGAVDMVAGALGQKVPFEVYEHHGNYLFPKWAFANDEAPLILRQKRRRASMADGAGSSPDLSPGHRFALQGHPAPQLDHAYVATSVKHRGETRADGSGEWRVYSNTFECAPAEMTFLPPRPKRKSVQVALTATVVGPPGEEIHVDPLGQIKVQFHWDREGKFDDKSSCWIRTMQPWGGAAWGHQFIPRIGMEVVVVFEGGDPDKPMVLGSLYNGTHPVPFTLPHSKTKSGIRTRSTPGGRGYNEISFEDHAGGEIFHVHAQRDYEEVIRHDQRSHVMHGRAVRIDGGATEHIGHTSTLDVGRDRTTIIGGADHLRVLGQVRHELRGDRTTEIDGSSVTTVKGAHSLEVHGHRAIVVGTPDEPARNDSYVYGGAALGSSEKLFLASDKNLVLQCGNSTIEMTPDKIVIKSPTVEISPTQSLECGKKGGPSMTLGDGMEILTKKFSMFTESGALEVDKDFKAKGSAIKLGYDPSKPSKDDKDKDPEKKPFSCKLQNYYFQPYANKTFHLLVEGLRIEGQTDGDGIAKADIPKDAKQVVVRLWIDDYPEGRQRQYTLNLDKMPPAQDVVGAKHRLASLGYYDGLLDADPSAEFRSALAEFQQDHKDSHALSPTGELDAGTAGALEELHGS
jgi:type VI secretion system secreted protein VgrG